MLAVIFDISAPYLHTWLLFAMPWLHTRHITPAIAAICAAADTIFFIRWLLLFCHYVIDFAVATRLCWYAALLACRCLHATVFAAFSAPYSLRDISMPYDLRVETIFFCFAFPFCYASLRPAIWRCFLPFSAAADLLSMLIWAPLMPRYAVFPYFVVALFFYHTMRIIYVIMLMMLDVAARCFACLPRMSADVVVLML